MMTELCKYLHRLPVTIYCPLKNLCACLPYMTSEKLSGTIMLMNTFQIRNHAELTRSTIHPGIQLAIDDDSSGETRSHNESNY